ncbi:hypothetical protein [Nocardia pseudobrasiliensis]|uniref:Uncharacterized protein n=1 Tax=Nocardia pseudobrasiliensis TaxID=45979 RepID=A0A370I4R5_9NOCA|nr:hypothetical protein [Nocardia pseudobrasiliensis]RDI65590.1 hypothetical protein DFR76_106462 [Nocardia pseudobrasiliensis]
MINTADAKGRGADGEIAVDSAKLPPILVSGAVVVMFAGAAIVLLPRRRR